jgi:hypothetical protein
MVALMKRPCFTVIMTETPLRDGVLHLLAAVRQEEWTLHRVLDANQREQAGTEGAPEIKDLLAQTNAARQYATVMLREVAAGRPANGCAPVEVGPVGNWSATHAGAHDAMVGLVAAVNTATENDLAEDPGKRRNHPQYVWRDVVIYAARGPMGEYAAWHQRQGRSLEGLGVLSRWYEAVRGSGLPTKALSDASYDLACGFARAGRPDEAMAVLPDAFVYNDRAAVPVLKAWAREDRDLAPLADRPDFRALVGTSP